MNRFKEYKQLLTEQAQAEIKKDTRVSLQESDPSYDNSELAVDPDDQEAYFEFEDAERNDDTNSNGNVNPEARSNEGKRKVRRVYESVQDQVQLIKTEEKIKGSDLKQKQKDDSYTWVYSVSAKRAFLVDVQEMDYEEVEWRKAIKEI